MPAPFSRLFPRLLVAAAVCLPVAGVLPSPLGGAAAQADPAETTYPTNGAFALSGHGYGHGRGLSQWGAYGAAKVGLHYGDILDFYYPGTATADSGNPQLRVLLKRDDGVDVAVAPSGRTGALTVTEPATGRALPLPAAVGPDGVQAWRAIATGTGATRLEGLWAGAWRAFPAAAPWTSTSTLTFSSQLGRMTLMYPGGGMTDYRGALQAVPAAGGRLATVNVVAREDYLRGVVPSESPASWPADALRAQAVAARTYAVSVSTSGGSYDICDDSYCQVYLGMADYNVYGALVATREQASTDAAIADTARQVRTYGGRAIFAQFSSSNGGWTVAGTSAQPYLAARPDPYDGVVPSSAHDWTATLTADQVGQAAGVGRAVSLSVTGRDGRGDWGGRTTAVTVVGTAGSATLSGEDFRSRLGLRSSWWMSPHGLPRSLRDLVTVQLAGTGSGAVEVHTLSADAAYQAFDMHAATAFGPSDPNDWRFFTAPYAGSGAPDLYGVHLRGTGSGRVEVHVLSAESGYRTFVAHVATAGPAVPAGQSVDVALTGFGGDGQPDLYLVPTSQTGSGAVEVHVLAASTGWSGYYLHAVTALPTALVNPAEWHFLVGDAAGSGDLVGVRHAGATGSGRTEVHVLSRASAYRGWTAHVATAAALTDDARSQWALGDADGDGVPDVDLVLTRGTGSGMTEVHALGGSTGYAAWTLHTATGLPLQAASPWQLTFG